MRAVLFGNGYTRNCNRFQSDPIFPVAHQSIPTTRTAPVPIRRRHVGASPCAPLQAKSSSRYCGQFAAPF